MRARLQRLVLIAFAGLGLALMLDLGAVLGTGLGAGLGTASADPPVTERKVEILQHRPSGFWTSNRPAVGGAYRWRLLGIGVVLAAGSGYLMYRLVRRANAERLARDKSR